MLFNAAVLFTMEQEALQESSSFAFYLTSTVGKAFNVTDIIGYLAPITLVICLDFSIQIIAQIVKAISKINIDNNRGLDCNYRYLI